MSTQYHVLKTEVLHRKEAMGMAVQGSRGRGMPRNMVRQSEGLLEEECKSELHGGVSSCIRSIPRKGWTKMKRSTNNLFG